MHNRQNFPIFERARDALKKHKEELVAMTKLYPVVCEFAGYRSVFRQRSDVEGLLKRLDETVRTYAKHRTRPVLVLV